MPLDARGVWIDQVTDSDCGINCDKPSGPSLPYPGKPEVIPPPKELPPALDRGTK